MEILPPDPEILQDPEFWEKAWFQAKEESDLKGHGGFLGIPGGELYR